MTLRIKPDEDVLAKFGRPDQAHEGGTFSETMGTTGAAARHKAALVRLASAFVNVQTTHAAAHGDAWYQRFR